MMMYDSDRWKDQQRTLIYLLLLFYAVYWICAIYLQVKTYHPVSKQGSAFDVLTGTILMIMSVVAILIATQRSGNLTKLLLWLGVSAVAGALAIDEWFEFHEKTRHTSGSILAFGDDDYVKIALWVCAGIGIFVLHKIENLQKAILATFLVGYFFQSVYIVFDIFREIHGLDRGGFGDACNANVPCELAVHPSNLIPGNWQQIIQFRYKG